MIRKIRWKNLSPGVSGLISTSHCLLLPKPVLSTQLSNLFCFFLKQVNLATAPMHGGHVALWTSAASKAVSCGVWRCTVHLPRLARLLALCVHSATQTCQEHPRLVPQGTKWTRAQSVGQHSSQTRQKTRRWAQHRTTQKKTKKTENRIDVLVASVRACTCDNNNTDEKIDTVATHVCYFS